METNTTTPDRSIEVASQKPDRVPAAASSRFSPAILAAAKDAIKLEEQHRAAAALERQISRSKITLAKLRARLARRPRVAKGVTRGK